MVSKTNDQANEVKLIAGAGRIIYDIFIHCQFIPIEYLCLLATILNNSTSYQYISSSVILPYTYSTYDENIDLILNTGAFYITTKEITNDTMTNIATNIDIEATFPQTINSNSNQDTHIHRKKKQTSEEEIMIEKIKEIEYTQTQLNKDDLIMQVTLQNSFNTLKEENRNTEKNFDNEIMDWNTQTKQEKTIKKEATRQITKEQHITCSKENLNSRTLSELHKNNNNPNIYAEFIEGTKDKVLRKIFSKYGYIKHIVHLSTATAVVVWAHNSIKLS